MNIDIINIGHYRITNHGGRAYDMFNRKTDRVFSLNERQFKDIKEQMSILACQFVEDGELFRGN